MSEPLVLTRSFEASEPIDMNVTVGSGTVEVVMTDAPDVEVTVRHAPEQASPWAESLTTLVTLFSGQPQTDAVGEALRQTTIEFGAGRLLVRTPQSPQLRAVPVRVTVRAPAGSHVTTRGASAAVSVAGPAGRVEASSGAGAIDVEQARSAQLTSGSGPIRLTTTDAGFQARTSSGDVTATQVTGPSNVFTGSGTVWLGTIKGDVMVRTGTGNITIADAVSGQLELTTGSGNLRVGVHKDSAADIDLSSGSGQARSELPLTTDRPTAPPPLRVRGRTGSGAAVIALAAT